MVKHCNKLPRKGCGVSILGDVQSLAGHDGSPCYQQRWGWTRGHFYSHPFYSSLILVVNSWGNKYFMKWGGYLATHQQKTKWSRKRAETLYNVPNRPQRTRTSGGSTLQTLTRGAATGSNSKGQRSGAVNQQSGGKGPLSRATGMAVTKGTSSSRRRTTQWYFVGIVCASTARRVERGAERTTEKDPPNPQTAVFKQVQAAAKSWGQRIPRHMKLDVSNKKPRKLMTK